MFEQFIKLALAVLLSFFIIVLGLIITHYAEDLLWVTLFGAIAILVYKAFESDITKRR